MIFDFFFELLSCLMQGDDTQPADSRYNRFSRWLRYSISGLVSGFIAYIVYHERFITSNSLRIANLLLMPYLCALIVSYIYKYALKNRTLTFSMKHWYVFFFLFLLMQFLPVW